MSRLAVCTPSEGRLADGVLHGRLAVLPPLGGRRPRQTRRMQSRAADRAHAKTRGRTSLGIAHARVRSGCLVVVAL
jgi:hypothetical protein